MIRIKHASFVLSAPSLEETVDASMSEVAFLGRSNVGKSSLINALTNKKSLAKSSSTPGKTRLINFFDVVYEKEATDFAARFVDLPGFGYAKVSKSMKYEWQKNLTEFILKRTSIRVFVHLRDARHPQLAIDDEVLDYLKEICRPDQEIIIFFTKADKIGQKEKSFLKKIDPQAQLVAVGNKKTIQDANERIFQSLFGMCT
ncbi:MAG: YihA family ribosome biogenesis GTP-binding protein [Sulfurospirillum sp.]|nr:YihA family ribosome biogenesis GTP-binding protein [Sulfurospirillum sp.]